MPIICSEHLSKGKASTSGGGGIVNPKKHAQSILALDALFPVTVYMLHPTPLLTNVIPHMGLRNNLGLTPHFRMSRVRIEPVND